MTMNRRDFLAKGLSLGLVLFGTSCGYDTSIASPAPAIIHPKVNSHADLEEHMREEESETSAAAQAPQQEQEPAQAPNPYNYSEAETNQKRELYNNILEGIHSRRLELKGKYDKASPEKRRAIIEEARDFVLDSISKEIFPAWYGTTWDFYGFTNEPGKGMIACGAFVSTVLKHADFNLSRGNYSAQPAEHIIKNLTAAENIKRYSNKDVAIVKGDVEKSGKGLYIVGLDCHVGFILNDGKEVRFVHSSYYKPPFCVVSEAIDSYNPLSNSKYRVVGKILSDEMMQKWLTGEAFPLKFDYFKGRN